MQSKVYLEVVRLGGLAPVLVLLCAAIMIGQAAYAVHDLLEDIEDTRQVDQLPKFQLNKKEVSSSAYERYAQTLSRLTSKVDVSARGSSLEIKSIEAQSFPEFLYVLTNVQGIQKGVVWEAKEICLGTCAAGGAKAIITGIIENVEVSLQGDK